MARKIHKVCKMYKICQVNGQHTGLHSSAVAQRNIAPYYSTKQEKDKGVVVSFLSRPINL